MFADFYDTLVFRGKRERETDRVTKRKIKRERVAFCFQMSVSLPVCRCGSSPGIRAANPRSFLSRSNNGMAC